MAVSKSPDDSFAELAARLNPLPSETVALTDALGRVLAESVVADRDSPAADVSAMDGYAVRLEDLHRTAPILVSGESIPGHEPPTPVPGKVMRVFTGGIVPAAFDLVVKREDTEESPESVKLSSIDDGYENGTNIRRQGENTTRGDKVLTDGGFISAAAIAAAANFGATKVPVRRELRVSILVTGDELQPIDAAVQPWQLRDSNGPTVGSILAGQPWCEVVSTRRVVDSMSSLKTELKSALDDSDAVILTGGVSMGDYDHVPDAVQHVGAEIAFHRLPIRPGKPIMGAATSDGRPIIGLPGNPVSAAVGCQRFVVPLLLAQAGASSTGNCKPAVILDDAGDRTLPLYWYRLVRISERGTAEPVPSKGSGDLVSLSHSDGFIEQPPGQSGPGPWKFWSWS